MFKMKSLLSKFSVALARLSLATGLFLASYFYFSGFTSIVIFGYGDELIIAPILSLVELVVARIAWNVATPVMRVHKLALYMSYFIFSVWIIFVGFLYWLHITY
jgi:hypothetical protein